MIIKNGGKFFGIGVIFLCVGCLAVVILGNFTQQPGCRVTRSWFRNMCEYSRDFPVDSLLADQSDFSIQVEVIPIKPAGMHGTAERTLGEIYLTNGKRIGTHEIERWFDSTQAEDSFVSTNNTVGLNMPPCGIRSNLDYQSPVADRFCAACSIGNHCQSVGQYQDYVSIFLIDIEAAGLTPDDFAAILVKIDKRMAQYLDLNL